MGERTERSVRGEVGMDLCNGVDREKVTAGLECCQKSQCNKCPYYCASDCTVDLASDTLDLLKEQKPIVRCRDCKHQDPDRFYMDSSCYILCRKGHGWKPDNWFCADGERQ